MRLYCPFEGCKNHPTVHTFQVVGDFRYSIDHCKEHQKWAVDYLKCHLTVCPTIPIEDVR